MRALTLRPEKELRAQRRLTANLIAASPRAILLHRKGQRQGDGEGGFLPAGPDVTEDRPVLRYFAGLVGGARTSNPSMRYRHDEEGDRLVTKYMLIGKHTDDIRKGDWFFIDDNRFNVIEIAADRTYQIKAFCELVTDGN